ncbi:hypothetical protein GCM10012287_14620 [Streptomyces daqingensis]|uniref:Uncharacterized protein n=1 Tax=Streptomyces daqingensis TaxID=1472640 RepID=A0ABQ2M4H3_9ACTN|nr:hypothetical protein GCM10012287_14620 [Streptomyces daqingensis]
MFESMAGSLARSAVEGVANSALPHAPTQDDSAPDRGAPVAGREQRTMRFRLARVLRSLADRLAPTS